MTRFIQFGSVAAAALAAIGVFHLKHRAELLTERIAALQLAVDKETETVALLKAEWSLLMQPGRIQSIVERHPETFALEPLKPEQITTAAAVPARVVDSIEDAIAGAGATQ